MIGRWTRVVIITVVSGLVLSCAVKKPQTDLGLLPSVEIQDIRVTEGAEKTVIEVEGEEPMIYTTFHLSDPDRLVVDMAGVSLGRFTESFQMNQGPIRAVRPVAEGGGNNVSRLEFLLRESVVTDIRTEGLNLIVEATQSQKADGFVFFDDAPDDGKTPEETAPPETEPVVQEAIAQKNDEGLAEPATMPEASALLVIPSDAGDTDASVLPPFSKATEEPRSTTAKPTGEISQPKDETLADKLPLQVDSAISLQENVQPLPPAKKVTAVRFDRNESLQLIIEADGELFPRIFYVDDKRLVIDLPGVKKTMEGHRIPANDPLVEQVRMWQHPKKLRLVLDLLSPIPYDWTQTQGTLVMDLIGTAGRPAESKLSSSASPDPAPLGDESYEDQDNPDKTKPEPPVVPSLGEALPTPPTPVLFSALEKPAGEVEKEPRALEKKSIGEPIHPLPVSDVEKSTQPKPPAKPAAVLAEKTERKKRALLKRRKRREKIRLKRAALARVKSQGKKKKQVPLEPPQRPKFIGRKISLDFQDADISNVIRLIADVSKLNFVMGGDVKGKITLKVTKVPWDQALDIILKTHNLGQVREGNIIRIATLANLSKQRDEEAHAKETKIKAEDLANRVVYINYGKAGKLSLLLQKLLSPRGEIMVSERVNALIIKDIAQNLDEIEKMAMKLDTKTPQVLIEARIVEINPTFKRSLGVQWGADSKTTQGGNVIGIGNPSGSSFTSSPPFSVDLPANDNFGGLGFTFGRLTQSPFTLDLRLSAGETQGMTRIVSTPKIMVLDNHEALIEQGESIPFQTDSGNEGKKIEFIDANLKLNVTPHISLDGGIMLDILLTKNERGVESPIGFAINKKEVTTRVLLMNTETMVIGGIYETKKSRSESGIPWLKDIPFVGWLFKKKEVSDSISELLVFITPTIMD